MKFRTSHINRRLVTFFKLLLLIFFLILTPFKDIMYLVHLNALFIVVLNLSGIIVAYMHLQQAHTAIVLET